MNDVSGRGERLEALAKRVEAATGPDREIDALVHCAHHGLEFVCLATGDEAYGDICDPSDSGYGTRNKTTRGFLYARYPDHLNLPTLGGGRRGNRVQGSVPPAYSGSLDAAMMLVPNGRDWMVDNFDGYHDRRCSASVFNEAGASYKDYEARAATPALALTAACLRAIAHQDLAQSPNIAGGGE